MRLLAVDLGDKRTGLAVGDTRSALVTPIAPVVAPRVPGKELLRCVAAAASEYDAGRIVVGLPLHMDGKEGARAKIVRGFGAAIVRATGIEPEQILYQDERLTSAQADWEMAGSGLTHKQRKKIRDSLAAAAILRDYLQAASGGGA